LTQKTSFAGQLIAWQKRHGRRNLPWQGTKDPYRIWVAEIMLQQTQVATAIPYYQRFVLRFPDLASLAKAPLQDVLALWAGLGYYTRARNLHRAASQVEQESKGQFPRDFAALKALPGVGRSTAAAIAVAAFGERQPILDGNVKRVLTRCFAIAGDPADRAVENQLWELAAKLLPEREIAVYTQALMDLGATVCTPKNPACGLCPLAARCQARARDLVAFLPAPRPRKTLPERELTLPLVVAAGNVLLEQRPPTGIWGGLWSLPELSADTSVATMLAPMLRMGALTPQPLPVIRHRFTHFRLLLHPVLYRLDQPPMALGEPGRAWFSKTALTRIGMPSPIAKLLLGVL
jgi:A/G-specific adenine glycosylase